MKQRNWEQQKNCCNNENRWCIMTKSWCKHCQKKHHIAIVIPPGVNVFEVDRTSTSSSQPSISTAAEAGSKGYKGLVSYGIDTKCWNEWILRWLYLWDGMLNLSMLQWIQNYLVWIQRYCKIWTLIRIWCLDWILLCWQYGHGAKDVERLQPDGNVWYGNARNDATGDSRFCYDNWHWKFWHPLPISKEVSQQEGLSLRRNTVPTRGFYQWW